MKKLLLSSIIMFGVCSFATAQNVTTGSKLQKASATTTSISPAPQKSVAATGSETIVGEDGVARPTADQAVAAKTNNAVAADVAGVTVTDQQIAKKKEMQKAAEAKAAPAGKRKQN